jgi:hypothetical protein
MEIPRPTEMTAALDRLEKLVKDADDPIDLGRASAQYLLIRNMEEYFLGETFGKKVRSLNTAILKRSKALGLLEPESTTPEEKPPPEPPETSAQLQQEATDAAEEARVDDGVVDHTETETQTPAGGTDTTTIVPQEGDTDPRADAMIKECDGKWLDKEYKKRVGEAPKGVNHEDVIAMILKCYDGDKSPFTKKDDPRFKELVLSAKRSDIESLYVNTARKAMKKNMTRFEMAEAIILKEQKSAHKELSGELQETLDEETVMVYRLPSDPMPQHKDTVKTMYGGISEFFECEGCQGTDNIMCLPATPLEGKLRASIKCQTCAHEEFYDYDGNEGPDEIRKVGKLLKSFAPFTPLVDELTQAAGAKPKKAKAPRKKSQKQQAMEPPPQPQTQTDQAPEQKPPTVTVDPATAVSSVVAPPNDGPPVDPQVFAGEIQQDIAKLPEEQIVSKYQQMTGLPMPAGLDEEAKKKWLAETAIPAISKAMANLNW